MADSRQTKTHRADHDRDRQDNYEAMKNRAHPEVRLSPAKSVVVPLTIICTAGQATCQSGESPTLVHR
jgi:hypothetical protein